MEQASDRAKKAILEAELTIEHAHRGYANVQETIRFIDQKNAFVSSLSTVVGGVSLTILAKIFGRSEDQFAAPLMTTSCGHYVAMIVISASLLLCVLCIRAVVQSVCAAAPPPDRDITHSILFPFITDADDLDHIGQARDHYKKTLASGVEKDLILREFADQLTIVGGIISKKRKHHVNSVGLFLWQIGTLVAGVILGLITTQW